MKPLRVMVVEDDYVLRVILIAYMQGEDRLEVVRAFPRRGGLLEAVLAEQPDVIVVDEELDEQSGLGLLLPLRRCAPSATLVVWSQRPELEPWARALGADAYIDKAHPLSDIVDAALEAHAQPRSNGASRPHLPDG